jgi:hypothetical protein
MPFDGTPSGREPHGPWCASCKAPIVKDQRSVHVHFDSDPQGFRGLTGEYHEACSKPFASLARAINAMSFRRF